MGEGWVLGWGGGHTIPSQSAPLPAAVAPPPPPHPAGCPGTIALPCSRDELLLRTRHHGAWRVLAL